DSRLRGDTRGRCGRLCQKLAAEVSTLRCCRHHDGGDFIDACCVGFLPAYLPCAEFRVASLHFFLAASNSAVCKGKRLVRPRGHSAGLAPLRTSFEYPVSTWTHTSRRDAHHDCQTYRPLFD